MRNTSLYTLLLVGALTLISVHVLAAGGGGGGSVPSCNEDVWDCTGWSQCSEAGTQTRVCNLSFDCGNADTPKPAESQSCTPPVPTQPEPEPTPVPIPVPSPTTAPASAPPCTKDTFACSNWSAACDANGRENRTCRLTFDCSNAQTPPPFTSRACQKLQCGNKNTLGERIICRLNLAPAGVARELEIQYLPEGCKAETGDEQKECINIYKSFQPCWAKKAGEERFACARSALKLGPLISQEVKLCQGKKGNEQAECKHEIKDRVLFMITFRFYDLETRAEALADRGADLNTIADFETIIEAKKQEFYKAKDNQERLKIILDVRKAWNNFVDTVKKQVI